MLRRSVGNDECDSPEVYEHPAGTGEDGRRPTPRRVPWTTIETALTTKKAKRNVSMAGMAHAESLAPDRQRQIAMAGVATRWGVTGLLVLLLGSSGYAQAPNPADEDALELAEAVVTLRELAVETGVPESAEVAEARAAQREACGVILNPVARAICTVGLAVAFDVGVPVIVGWLAEDGEAMTRESQDVLGRLGELEEWQRGADDRFSEMDSKLDRIIELLSDR